MAAWTALASCTLGCDEEALDAHTAAPMPEDSAPGAATSATMPARAAAGSGGAHPAAGSGAPSTGSAGAPAAVSHSGHAEAHESTCPLHLGADPRDAELSDEPLVKQVGTTRDLLVPQPVLDWMAENQFEAAHDAWHLVRKWDQGCRKSNASADGCVSAQRLVAQGLWRADIQQGAPGDGYAFMVMHRHMLQMLRASFPKHAALFDGFTHVPRSKADDQNFATWHNIAWTSDNLKGLEILEHIEQHLEQFPTDDDLGQYIENTYRWTASEPQQPVDAPGSGLHGALHAQWAVTGSPGNLIEQSIDVRNYMFWKLHGWIDGIWQRYRKAKGLPPEDPQLSAALEAECQEMFTLEPRNRKGMAPPAAGSGSLPAESGFFAANVRPALDGTCAGCHGAIGPNAGLTLGGAGVSSADVIANLVNVKATNGEYDLIEPGDPQRSWLFLKASGGAASAQCMHACDRESMPPAGMGLSATQLSTLEQWIRSGASAQ